MTDRIEHEEDVHGSTLARVLHESNCVLRALTLLDDSHLRERSEASIALGRLTAWAEAGLQSDS